MKKRKWLVSLICLMGLFLIACSGSGTMASEEIDLQHLVTPARLAVQSKEVYEMVQETGNSGPGDAIDDPSQLEDEERQEVESFFGQLPERMQEIEERTIEIRDEATIDTIFDALRTASGEYVNDDEDMASWLDGDFYYIRVAYDDESINQRGYAMDYPEQMQDGYVFHLYVLEDDRLFFPDGKTKDEGGQGMVAVPIDFRWFEGLLTELTDESLLTENDILEAFENRNIDMDELAADLNIEIYSTIWEALEEHRRSQDLGESFAYWASENTFQFWVKNAVITLNFEDLKQEDVTQTLVPVGDVIFEDLNPMEEILLEGESGAWRAAAPIQYYAYTYEDAEGEAKMAAYYQLDVALSYQGSVENPSHELKVIYEIVKHDGYRRSAIESVIGPAEEVLMDDGLIDLKGFQRSGPEPPLDYDHTIYVTGFYGEEIEIELSN